jgi:ABC-type glycerol-3-phosphate transport system substrate-binding protein
VPNNKYHEKPNPYITSGQPGSKRWRDLFLPGIDFWRAPNNDLYLILADQIQVCIYYNKEIFKKVGLDGAPKTW